MRTSRGMSLPELMMAMAITAVVLMLFFPFSRWRNRPKAIELRNLAKNALQSAGGDLRSACPESLTLVKGAGGQLCFGFSRITGWNRDGGVVYAPGYCVIYYDPARKLLCRKEGLPLPRSGVTVGAVRNPAAAVSNFTRRRDLTEKVLLRGASEFSMLGRGERVTLSVTVGVPDTSGKMHDETISQAVTFACVR